MAGGDRHGGQRKRRRGGLFPRGRAALAFAGGGDENLHRTRILRDRMEGERRKARAVIADLAHVGTDAGGDAERGAEGEGETRRAKKGGSRAAPGRAHPTVPYGFVKFNEFARVPNPPRRGSRSWGAGMARMTRRSAPGRGGDGRTPPPNVSC